MNVRKQRAGIVQTGRAAGPAHSRARRRRCRAGIVVVALALALLTTFPAAPLTPSAAAFGTIRGLGQRAEHEIITRIALGCPAGAPTNGDCFEPVSLDQLAGKDGTFGAVGAPDSDDQIFDPAAHCDDADFLEAPGYPQSRAAATGVLQKCIDNLRAEFEDAVNEADDLLENGQIELQEVFLTPDCVFTGGLPGRAKCDVLQGFGRALHGVQDFYSHSNWADEADPGQPIGVDNPPGLNLPAPSPLLDLRSRGAVAVPNNLSTGFFKGGIPGQDACPAEDGRITHACLNKDKALIEPGAGLTVNGVQVSGLGNVSDPQTVRGKVQANALKAVGGAILETRRQWADFRIALGAKYGPQQAGLMIAALTKDIGGDMVPPIPDVPAIPPVPEIPPIPDPNSPPTAPAAPPVPNIPNVPTIPNIPGIPGLPGVPKP